MVDEEPIENNMDEGADDYRRLNRKCMLSMYINYAGSLRDTIGILLCCDEALKRASRSRL